MQLLKESKNILIVEDDERMLNNIEIICNSLGHKVQHT